MDKRTSKSVIQDLLPLENAVVVDVGCGDGTLARMMARRGAHVTGIEVSPRQLAKARAATAVGDERYMQGIAEDLPLKNRSADIVVFFNSLHHVEEPGLFKALREAARVLKPGGILFVSEPLAEGAYFELMKPAHDETDVRRRAQEALRHAPEVGLLLEKVLTHVDTVVLRDFEAFHERITQINPATRERFSEHEAKIREDFERLGQPVADGWAFDQPMRVQLLRRA
jgi:SAM-dependent methyltransferase